MTPVAEQSTLAAAFEAFKAQPAFRAGGLASAREAAFNRFVDAGFPTMRQEEWRHTNIQPIANTVFGLPASFEAEAALVEPFLFAEHLPHRVVLVNGRWSTALSSLAALPSGVTVRGMRDAVETVAPKTAPDWLVKASAGMPFVDLNTAFAEDGIVIEIAARAIVAEPIHVVCLNTKAASPVMVTPRVQIRAGEQAQAFVVESYASVSGEATFTNALTIVDVAAGAMVDHVKLQREAPTAFHLAAMFARVDRAGVFRSHAVTLGGRIARNDISATLAGDGAECTLDGLYVADGEALVDTHTTIDHAMPNCPSHELYKGILAGQARAVFNGKIIVRQDAQKTNAKQTNKALLLSDHAQVNTKPQLEIFADDVKCTHGAAIGQLDEDAMFYMQARGIDFADARNLLIHAFAGEVLDGVKEDVVREQAMRLLEQKLALWKV
ncbi:MAG TPA: Fe-S cluster assembly protein SufD [Vicinamibacterales bacterium]|nr:Fe-S cluster assembly protein SufD [Vicinamibacterales bacterium]